jgi:hypothetical protein
MSVIVTVVTSRPRLPRGGCGRPGEQAGIHPQTISPSHDTQHTSNIRAAQVHSSRLARGPSRAGGDAGLKARRKATQSHGSAFSFSHDNHPNKNNHTAEIFTTDSNM